MSEEEKTKKNQDLEDELAQIKSEMSEIKELLKAKKTDQENEIEYTVNAGSNHPRRARHVRPARPARRPRTIVINDEDIDIDVEGLEELGETMNHYIGNVLKGVEANLERSLHGITATFGVKTQEKMHRKAEKMARMAEKRARKAEHRLKKHERTLRAKEDKLRRYKARFQPLREDELEEFLDLAPNLAGSLADSRRLSILKELESGPQYTPELADKLKFKGGALKNHLDNLVETKFIQQEAVRGRYLITQLGMEGLKLVEMLFRRYKYSEKMESGEFDDILQEERERIHEEMEDTQDEFDDAVDDMLDDVDEFQDEMDEIQVEFDADIEDRDEEEDL